MKLYIFVIACFIAYLYCYFVFPSHISIIQTTLSSFNFNMLLERQPIVVDDTIKDILSVIDSWFSSNIIQDAEINDKKTWNINRHKYLVCYTLDDDELLLYKAGNSVVNDVADDKEPIIAITLKKHQTVIVPFQWYYNIKNKDNFKLYGVHDYCTYILNVLI